VLEEFSEKYGYRYDQHIAPHDIRVREIGNKAKSRYESALELGIKFTICPSVSVEDGIQSVRNILPSCVFDKSNCAEGLKALRHYRKKWNEERGCFENVNLP
jgi:hypothetical protein